MKNSMVFSVLLIFLLSCSGDDSENLDSNNSGDIPIGSKFDYKITILSPTLLDKTINDTMSIEIRFESGTGDTIHYIEIRIYNKSDATEIYKKPSITHINYDDGSYTFKDDFMLSVSNGVSVDTDWVLEAKVWATSTSEKEVIKTFEFYVNAN